MKKIKSKRSKKSRKLLRLEKRVDVLEKKIDKLTNMMECHIDFIDKTYEHLKNPIKSVSKLFGGK